MDTGILQNAQRLRYEALSHLAASLNRAENYKDVCSALSDNAKYIIDFYRFRLSHRHKKSTRCFEIYRGESITFVPKNDTLWEYEDEVLKKGLPVSSKPEDFESRPHLRKILFSNPKVAAIFSLPVTYFEQQEIIISISVTNSVSYIEIDFKFLKAIADLVANKLLQLELLKKIESSNKELKIKNAQITKLNRTLEQTVALRTAELTSANEEMRTLFYRTSHDFRAPLANIMGLANLAKLVTDDEEALDLFAKCEEVVHKLDGMLNKLNVLSNYAYEHQIKPVDFAQLLDDLKNKYQSQLNEIGGRLIYDIQIDNMHISVPHTYITILDNLLENSVCYHKGDLLVQIYIFKYKDDLVIKFSDNGQGIPTRIIGKIYDMYYRGHAQSTGSGLGLYVVRKLVKSLAGDIWVQSKPKQHTHFIIKVPFQQHLQ
ncbi:HAMP domain-containing histidine kinase [Mucilaginibacter limnophilus]|uniref:histidine kinase n=1 Tax=Mucilaginibacter limnophilus TaxID=1932778 RepID=A0A437MY09_9SPHI|nr:HAMP domain-containing sensor histidine kinase [Mucilaginibacter limnophilus]RVU02571.1 HAMP domain-containing histidine kinase [Mucilaginibacter limnophilus]